MCLATAQSFGPNLYSPGVLRHCNEVGSGKAAGLSVLSIFKRKVDCPGNSLLSLETAILRLMLSPLSLGKDACFKFCPVCPLCARKQGGFYAKESVDVKTNVKTAITASANGAPDLRGVASASVTNSVGFLCFLRLFLRHRAFTISVHSVMWGESLKCFLWT